MSNESAFENIRNGFSNTARLLSLWCAFGLAINAGLGTILDVSLISEPFGSTTQLGSFVAVCVTCYVDYMFPNIRTETVWRFGITVFLSFVVIATINSTLHARTSGSLYYTVTAIGTWIAALMLGISVAWPDDR